MKRACVRSPCCPSACSCGPFCCPSRLCIDSSAAWSPETRADPLPGGNRWARVAVQMTVIRATIRGRSTRTHQETAMFAARPRRAAAAVLAVLPVVGACSRSGSTMLPAPAPLATTTLLTRLGADTLAVEQYTRNATHMEGVLVTRSPTTLVARYSVQISPSGAPTRADYSVRKGDGTPIPGELQSLSVRYGPDSAYLVGHRSAGDTVGAIAARGDVLPSAQGSYGLSEIALSRLLASGRDSILVALVPFSITA